MMRGDLPVEMLEEEMADPTVEDSEVGVEWRRGEGSF